MANALVSYLLRRYYRPQDHPYVVLENTVLARTANVRVVLDVGCGATAPLLNAVGQEGQVCIGVDATGVDSRTGRVLLVQGDLARCPLGSDSVDVAISRSVIEHITDPTAVFAEIYRVLKPGGTFV